jgi:TPP-dependent pyruvate/acetoin dehydrogenase alpha subunit
MTWELYEVWARTVDGHEDLIDTTKSLKEARELAELNIDGEIIECVIYRETPEGDPVEVEIVK